MPHLTAGQRATLLAAITADPAAAAMYQAGNLTGLEAWLNTTAAPDFVCWRPNVRASEIGRCWVGTDIDGMSALNMQRLQLMLASHGGDLFDMGRADLRAGFENPFGTNTQNASRVAMRAAWKVKATRFEKLFAAGAGTDASPALLGVDASGAYIQGAITFRELEGL